MQDYLTYNLADAYIVGILIYAMSKKHKIISEIPISESLYFSLVKYLIPFLTHINNGLFFIEIEAPLFAGKYDSKYVGTGISCGVDSLSTIVYHGVNELCPNYKIDTLTLLNTGYYGIEDNSSRLYNKYVKQSEDFSLNNGYHFLTVDSNIASLTKYKFLTAHTFLTCSCILLFQKYFKRYYYASGYSVYNFEANFDDSAYYDIFLLKCISTNNIEFISSCTTMKRIEKISMLIQKPQICDSLYVCTSGNPPYNCGKCEKCVRTLLAFDSLGKIDCLPKTFDKSMYLKNRVYYIAFMLRSRRNQIFYKEIYQNFKCNHIRIPVFAYFLHKPFRFELIVFKAKLVKSRIVRYFLHR